MNTIPKTKISKLPSIEKVSSTDRILLSTNQNLNDYQSKNVQLRALYGHLIKYVELVEKFSPHGELLAKSLSSIIKIKNCSETLDVPNLKYVNDNFMKLIKWLDDLVYNGYVPEGETEAIRNIPSHVGQIVMGDNLISLDVLKNIYGEKTNWIEITGRFLLGSGMPGENNVSTYGILEDDSALNISNKKFGGVPMVKLTNITPHSHCFSGVKYKYFPKKQFAFGVDCEETFPTYSVYKNNGGKYGRYHSGLQIEGIFNYHQHKKTTHLKANTPDSPDVFLGSSRETKNFTFKAAGDITENNSDEIPHNNMPPYYATHIWERTK